MPDSHCPTKTLSEHGDMEKRRLFHVPANLKLLTITLRCVAISDFRLRYMSDEFSDFNPTKIDEVSI